MKTISLYRLTLAQQAFLLFASKYKCRAAFQRPDGKWDVAISVGLADQIKTAALPNENLSDTILRIAA